MKVHSSLFMDLKTWREKVEPGLRRQAYATIEHDPTFLFEREGGPAGIKADLYLARLIGPNDEIVDDTLHLSSALYEIRVPRPDDLTAASFDVDPLAYVPMKINLYKLQSNWSTMKLSPEYGFEGMSYGPDFMATLVFLRYRRWLDFT